MHCWVWSGEEGAARMTLGLGSWDHLRREWRGLWRGSDGGVCAHRLLSTVEHGSCLQRIRDKGQVVGRRERGLHMAAMGRLRMKDV